MNDKGSQRGGGERDERDGAAVGAPSGRSGGGDKGVRRKRRVRRRVEAPRAGTSWRSRILLALSGSLALVLTSLLVVYPSLHGPGEGAVVELTLASGNVAQLTAELARAGLVSSPRMFAIYARAVGLDAGTIMGSHLLTDDLSPSEILARLERRGGAPRIKVTFPEGFTRFDMARRLADKRVCSEKAFLAATADASILRQFGIESDSADGFLFPATYEIAADSDPKDVAIRLLTEFDKRFQQLAQGHELGRADLQQSLGWQRQEIVTLASMIEKEAAVDDERPVIASVFLNRLRDPQFKRKVLQSDPTSAYGCLVMRDQIKACAGFNGKITHELNTDPANLYSTYVHEKLPPGPICNPGAKSLEAVLAPATTKFLYFVARGEGRHTFSETYESHTSAVKKGGGP